jgi:hypothetical protein
MIMSAQDARDPEDHERCLRAEGRGVTVSGAPAEPSGAIYDAFTVWRQRMSRPSAAAPFAEEIESVLFASAPWSAEQARRFGAAVADLRRGSGGAGCLAAAQPGSSPSSS